MGWCRISKPGRRPLQTWTLDKRDDETPQTWAVVRPERTAFLFEDIIVTTEMQRPYEVRSWDQKRSGSSCEGGQTRRGLYPEAMG